MNSKDKSGFPIWRYRRDPFGGDERECPIRERRKKKEQAPEYEKESRDIISDEG